MIKTLINAWEIKKYSKINLPECDIRKIKNTEELEFIKCLGIKFYQELLDDKIDYSKVSSYEEREYVKDELTIYKGFVYKAIEVNSSAPTNIEFWEPASKFEKPCFENFWCDYLAEYLAMIITRKNVIPMAIQLTPNGLVRQIDKSSAGFVPSTDKEINSYLSHMDSQIAECFELIDYVLMKNKDKCFNNYKGNLSNCCGDCGEPETECECGTDCLTNKKTKNRYHFA